MSVNWHGIILDTQSDSEAWSSIFSSLLEVAQSCSSSASLHNKTIVPDRLLSEGAWGLWHAYPDVAPRTSVALQDWCNTSSSCGRAVLILDALSLQELPLLLGGAESRHIEPNTINVTGSECPSTTDEFAKSLGLPSRSVLSNNKKTGTFRLFEEDCYTDVISIPFEDCWVPPTPNLFIWHGWLDDLIHLQNKSPDQISKITSSILQSDGFWSYVNKLRQGRKLVITSDHGYASSKRFSSEVTDTNAVAILRETFRASRSKPASAGWEKRFMPPIVMSHNGQHVVMGQRKWKVQGGFPHLCHGGMSLLEVAVPWIEFSSL